MLDDSLEELSASAQFGDEVYVVLVFKKFIEFKDSRMIKHLENLNLLAEPFNLLDLILFYFLDSSFEFCFFVLALVDDTITPSSKRPLCDVVAVLEPLVVFLDHA